MDNLLVYIFSIVALLIITLAFFFRNRRNSPPKKEDSTRRGDSTKGIREEVNTSDENSETKSLEVEPIVKLEIDSREREFLQRAASNNTDLENPGIQKTGVRGEETDDKDKIVEQHQGTRLDEVQTIRLVEENLANPGQWGSETESSIPESPVKQEESEGETADQTTPNYKTRRVPPTYVPPAPPAPQRDKQERNVKRDRATVRQSTVLSVRLQLVFDRLGSVKRLALLPERFDGMPEDLEVTGAQDGLRLSQFHDDYCEPIDILDRMAVLDEGIEWYWKKGTHIYRWVLSRREVYILAPGDVLGLHGFVSTARLWLNTRHVVLAKRSLRDEVMIALSSAGCIDAEVSEDKSSVVPIGWILIRNVIPSRAVAMREERHILNVLCPVHEIETHFTGGIRLERNTYLFGYPPRIRFRGEIGSDIEVMIDGKRVETTVDGALEAPGWDVEGEHRLWFGDRVESYSIRRMEENWELWGAYNFNLGASICGAALHLSERATWYQIRVPMTNRLLLGANPGEVFYCTTRCDVYSESIIVFVPFNPVWALPVDPLHAEKDSARIVLLNWQVPNLGRTEYRSNRQKETAIRSWSTAVRNAGSKGLPLEVETEEAGKLWKSYRAVAKNLRRRKE